MAVEAFNRQRELEMQRGRQAVQARSQHSDQKQFKTALKEADARAKEDEERRAAILENPETAEDKRLRDVAGAEVQDQAQTLHEAVLHLADREEPIIDFRRQRRVDLLEDDTVDTGLAREITVEAVKAQAVNQPTIMANEQGQDTEETPPNISLFANDELSLNRVVLPPDNLVPKTKDQAEQKAEGCVPETEQVVGEGKVSNDQFPETIEAVDIFESADDIALSWPTPGDADKRLEDDEEEKKPVAARRGRPRKQS